MVGSSRHMERTSHVPRHRIFGHGACNVLTHVCSGVTQRSFQHTDIIGDRVKPNDNVTEGPTVVANDNVTKPRPAPFWKNPPPSSS
jgi:hypothetical protein